MEDPHTHDKEGKGADESEDVVPEMARQCFSALCDVGSYHSGNNYSDAIECQDAPIWQGRLGKIPIRQLVGKKGYFEFVKNPRKRHLFRAIHLVLIAHKFIVVLFFNLKNSFIRLLKVYVP